MRWVLPQTIDFHLKSWKVKFCHSVYGHSMAADSVSGPLLYVIFPNVNIIFSLLPFYEMPVHIEVVSSAHFLVQCGSQCLVIKLSMRNWRRKKWSISRNFVFCFFPRFISGSLSGDVSIWNGVKRTIFFPPHYPGLIIRLPMYLVTWRL
jgi:hypothetical protein